MMGGMRGGMMRGGLLLVMRGKFIFFYVRVLKCFELDLFIFFLVVLFLKKFF